MTDNQWMWWQNALDGKVGPIHDGEPQSGYYRARKKGVEGLVPVAYWKDSRNGQQRCHVDGIDADPQRALEMWPYVSKRPVTYNAYRERLATGKWPDESAAVAAGHNAEPPPDDILSVRDRIEDLKREADQLIAAGAAQDEDAANRASDLAQALGELEAKAVALHKVEKEPHLEAGRAIDRKWFGLRDLAAGLKERLKAIVVTPFLVARDKAAKAAAAKAIAAGTPPADLPAQRTTAGTAKRATALRTQTTAEVSDWDVLIIALYQHPDIRATAQKIANASAKAGVALPGTKIVKIQVAA